MESRQVPVQVKTFSGAVSTGNLEVTMFSSREVWVRTLVKAGTVVALSLLSLLIPLLHFFTLPLGLFILLFTFFSTARTKAMITLGTAHCPECHKSITINPRRFELPFKDSCEHCHREVILSER